MTETQRLKPDELGLRRAAEILRTGGLVAFPTETVYGLGGDARSTGAVDAIYRAKERPPTNPLIVHVAEPGQAARYGRLSAEAERLAEAFWPGPLTLVVPRREGAGLAAAACAGLPTVALRIPANATAIELLRGFGGPIAAPSANRSGRVSATSAAHVLEGLADRIAAVIDAGPTDLGIESTILACAPDGVRLLRQGAIPQERIEALLARPVRADGETGPVRAPGQLASHYAPRARLRLSATQPRPGEAWLALGPVPPGVTGPALSLSRGGDLSEAAANLFAHLRALDAAIGGRGIIAVSQIPDAGIGRAINDRLSRAAAPRPSVEPE
ncbi:MAG: L-threonylcarbamoyladenylate synthase [Paracoccaceae bacterium]